jgi:hypothetical protein
LSRPTAQHDSWLLPTLATVAGGLRHRYC